MSRLFSLLCCALLISCVAAVPVLQQAQGSAEQLLAQVRATEQQTNQDSEVVADLKDQLADQIDNIKLADETDKNNVPEEKQSYQKRIDSLTESLNHSQEKLSNLTQVAATKKQSCAQLIKSKESTDVVVRQLAQAVAMHDDVLFREEEKSNTSISAIDRDLKIMEQVENYLLDAASESATKANMEPNALKHQVVSLMKELNQELEQTKASAISQWDATRARLLHESTPTRDNLTDKENEVKNLVADIAKCQEEQNMAEEQARIFHEQTIETMKKDLAESQASLDAVEPNYEQRHIAREKRLNFLHGLLGELQNSRH